MLSKKKVYVPIDVETELPDYGKKVVVIGEQKGMNPQMGGAYPFVTHRQELSKTMSALLKEAIRNRDENGFMYASYVKSWLKEEELYVFNSSELFEFAKEILRKGVNIGIENMKFEDLSLGIIIPDFQTDEAVQTCKEYIESLNIK